MLAKLKKAQAKGPEALAAALTECNKTLNVRNADKSTPAKTAAIQRQFIDDGGAEFCLELVQKDVHAQLAWETLWYASRAAETKARVFGVLGLVQAAVLALQGPSAVAAAYMLSNVARDASTGVPLARHPGLLEAVVKALEGPAAVAALALLCNLAALETNKMALAQTPGFFAAVEKVAVLGGEASTRSQFLLEQLQQQRVMTMMAVPVFVGGGAPESENMQVLMMQQQMQQQQQMFQQQMMHQQQMMMQQQAQAAQKPTTVVVNNGRNDDAAAAEGCCAILVCLICLPFTLLNCLTCNDGGNGW